ncbi:MAG: hypothetical protein IH878_13740 [Gemmatimonadetes bacterium]|nr:hypothetical protein [Gemmatimonadota bacterium]
MNKRRIILSVALLAAWVPALIGYAALAAEKPGGMKGSVIVSAAAESGASPLNSFMITPSSVNCVQGRLAIGADGTVGIPAPVIGPTVLRGSSDLATAVTWRVVALDSLDAAAREGLAQAYTVCTQTR